MENIIIRRYEMCKYIAKIKTLPELKNSLKEGIDKFYRDLPNDYEPDNEDLACYLSGWLSLRLDIDGKLEEVEDDDV